MGTAKQDGATNVDEEPTMDMNLEVVVMPVADVDRALRLLPGLGVEARGGPGNSGLCS
ncbi:hypothetical protein [Streptomyces sp. NPDC051219]|uniref:hypothetical protein n=1 Tax=Streptomyces sp. NPDC051219 TaxID=3155283 RepID=UPI00343DE429